MKQQYISPKAEVEIVCVEHYLQTESITGVGGGDTGYQGPGSGGGRGKEREEHEDNTTWGNLW